MEYVRDCGFLDNTHATGTQIYDFGALTFDTAGNLTAPATGSLPAAAVPIDVDSAGKDVEPLSITFLFNDGGTPIISQYASCIRCAPARYQRHRLG
jgi:hypothetical protein